MATIAAAHLPCRNPSEDGPYTRRTIKMQHLKKLIKWKGNQNWTRRNACCWQRKARSWQLYMPLNKILCCNRTEKSMSVEQAEDLEGTLRKKSDVLWREGTETASQPSGTPPWRRWAHSLVSQCSRLCWCPCMGLFEYVSQELKISYCLHRYPQHTGKIKYVNRQD